MNALQAGINAARAGQRAEARTLLQEVLQANPRSEQGWLWMSAVVESDDERRTCLERVLSINPNNLTAQTGLEKLGAAPGAEDGSQGYQPVASTALQPAAVSRPADALPLHSKTTQGLDPVPSRARPVRRLAPEPEPEDGLARLRAAQFQPPPAYAEAPRAQAESQSDPFMALVLIGGLSITAIAGAIMLGVLLIIGWPPQ